MWDMCACGLNAKDIEKRMKGFAVNGAEIGDGRSQEESKIENEERSRGRVR